jgi:G3E family GTPase
MKWLENWPEEIIRAKGFFWIASRNDMAGLISQAGSSITIQAAGEWIAAYPEEERKQILSDEPELLEKWEEPFGDRLTEIVFIGIEMNRDKLEQSLDQCLLTDKEMGEDWTQFHDPLPPFTMYE